MDSTLLIEHTPRGVARVTLNRPDVRNALDEALIQALTETFAAFDADPAVRVIVLAGSGRAFCAGADIAWMQRAAARDARGNLEDAQRLSAMMQAIRACRKPVVARIHGPAFGGGVGLACVADLAIASERASFVLSEARFGILPGVIGPYLIEAVGVRQATRLALSGCRVDASAALAIGLVHQVSAAEALDQAIEACIGELLQGGPLAHAAIKKLYAEIGTAPLSSASRERAAQVMSELRSSPEAQEGFAAFQEKRPARWMES